MLLSCVVTDPLFPSGSWTGFYIDGGCRFRQDVELEFGQDTLRGDGIDSIGQFDICGTVCRDSLEVVWRKLYPDGRTVLYRGFRERHGIWGTWEVDGRRGGFHIWPRARGQGDPFSDLVWDEIDEPVGAGSGCDGSLGESGGL